MQPPQAMEVRVKILYTSLWHSDVYLWEAKGEIPLFPHLFGHEAGGIVGSGVTDLQPGDHVIPVFTAECKDCAHCKSEESKKCDLLGINTDRGMMLSDGSLCSLSRENPYIALSVLPPSVSTLLSRPGTEGKRDKRPHRASLNCTKSGASSQPFMAVLLEHNRKIYRQLSIVPLEI